VTPTLQIPLWMWGVFACVVLVSLTLDLVLHRGGHGIGRKSAITWSIVWIVSALLFAGWVGITMGADHAQDFVSAYLMEKSLSVDNLFVFMVVFARLRIPEAEQHRVLYWGILGALVARAAFIAGGTALLQRWHDVVYVLGAFLIYTAYKTLRSEPEETVGKSRVLEWIGRHMRISSRLAGHHFITHESGRRLGTPLLLALITIEATDVLFAVDSVPAVLAISEEPFIVYSSNVFAILGMRALYLVLSDLLRDLHYLRYGLAAILALAGVKMLLSGHVHVPHSVSLGLIVAILVAAIVPSIRLGRRMAALR
jgi:tellurite resistance protein TerC